MKKILSIDGGGIRGIIPAILLDEIEKRTNKPVSKLFDLIAGTSTGGILALGLVKPNKEGKPEYSARQLADLYEKEGKLIFRNDIWHSIIALNGLADEKFTATGLEEVLQKYFGSYRLSDALTDVILTSYEIEKRTAYIIKSSEAKKINSQGINFYMKDAARATSAAPTYFEPVKIEVDGYKYAFIDGGVYANNPAMCGYVEAKTMFKNEMDFLVVSLGTGEYTNPIWYMDAKGWGLVRWAQPILNVVFDGVSDVVSYQLRQILPAGNYYRFQTKLDPHTDKLGNVSKENLNTLKKFALDIIKENDATINSLCSMLV